MNILRGYLTYIVAGIAVLFGAFNAIWGIYVDRETAIGILWAGLAVFGVRRAIG